MMTVKIGGRTTYLLANGAKDCLGPIGPLSQLLCSRDQLAKHPVYSRAAFIIKHTKSTKPTSKLPDSRMNSLNMSHMIVP